MGEAVIAPRLTDEEIHALVEKLRDGHPLTFEVGQAIEQLMAERDTAREEVATYRAAEARIRESLVGIAEAYDRLSKVGLR